MDPCPFVRIVASNLSLKLPENPQKSAAFYAKFKLKGFPTQSSDVSFLEHDAADSRIHACFSFSKAELEKRLSAERKSNNKCSSSQQLRIEIYCKKGRIGIIGGKNACGFSGKKLMCSITVQLDLKSVFESISGNSAVNSRSGCVVMQNGWASVNGSGLNLHLNVRSEPDPRFVFEFGGEPECSPQVFQVNGNVKQPVFSCKFGVRSCGERNLRSRSSLSEPSTSTSCFGTAAAASSHDNHHHRHERKGWSITIHDLSGSPVAAASMVTPFVPSPNTNRVSRSNPGAWLILRPCFQTTWKPWGRLEAWREKDSLGYRFELIPDESIDRIPLANSSLSTKNGGKFSIDITTGPTPLVSPNSSFDLSSGSGSGGSGSGSELGLGSGSGSWANILYRGFVMSSTVGGDGKRGEPVVEIGAQHVTCTEDAAAFVALAAAMDLSMDACKLFSKKLRKELRQPEL